MKKFLLFVAALLVSAMSFANIVINAETNKAFVQSYSNDERTFTVDGIEFGQIAAVCNKAGTPAALSPNKNQLIQLRKLDSDATKPSGRIYNKTAIDLDQLIVVQQNDKEFKVFAGNDAESLAEVAVPEGEAVKVTYVHYKKEDGAEEPTLIDVEADATKFVINLSGKKFFRIENAGNNTGYFFSIEIEDSKTSLIDNSVVASKAVKLIENGQLVIIRDGVRYNTVGQVIE